MQRKTLIARCLQLETKDSTDFPGGTLEGYASVFNNVDDGGDVVVKGAFAKTLSEMVPKKRVKILNSHSTRDTGDVLGLVTSGVEDNHGLHFQGYFSVTAKAQEVRTKVREGILDALSFGYDTIKGDRDPVSGVRMLKELKLWEVSVVIWGMNSQALITGAKAYDIPDSVIPVAAADTPWDPQGALTRVQNFIGKGVEPENWESKQWYQFAQMFAKRATGTSFSLDSYGSLLGDVVNGELMLIPAAIKSCLDDSTNNTADVNDKLKVLASKHNIELSAVKMGDLSELLTSMRLHQFLQKCRIYADNIK